MILKYRQKSNSRSRWFFIDNVQEIFYEEVTGKEAKMRTHNLKDIEVHVNQSFGNEEIYESDDYRFLEIWYKTKDKVAYLFTDDIIYLMNDEGKTVQYKCVG